jgi:hypothetical protein
MELGFPSRVEMAEGVDVGRPIADFSVTTNAIATVVNVEKVIRDTPH